MSQKLAKKIRKQLREGNGLEGVVKDENGKPVRLLMNRLDKNPRSGELDPLSLSGRQPDRIKTGGAINHPLSFRAQYQKLKRSGV